MTKNEVIKTVMELASPLQEKLVKMILQHKNATEININFSIQISKDNREVLDYQAGVSSKKLI